jgi:sugar lactone lactonase YvrE
MALQAQFIMYVGEFSGNSAVSKITSSGGVSTLASGFDFPQGLAVDATGNVYVTSFGINKITPDGQVSLVANGTNFYYFSGTNRYYESLNALAFDPHGNLYAAGDNGSVYIITPAGMVSTFVTGFSELTALAFDSSGNLFVADYDSESISKITPDRVISDFADFVLNPQALAFDPGGNLYSTDVAGYIYKITPAGVLSTFATVPGNTEGIASDSSGNLYVSVYSEFGLTRVYQVSPAGVVSVFATGGYGEASDIAIYMLRPPINLDSIKLSGANVTINGINGISGETNYVLASTNLALSFSRWTPVSTNVLSASGNFTITVTNTISPGIRQQFYILRH